jgi:hypothetical protein
MRPSQNKRMRGRNNNRKGPNPLSRTYESNGPDVKIRGTAHHIGEKYLQLARDAQSSGDPVMAESYLQHAEHYFRLIAAAQQAQQAAFGFPRPANEPEAEELEEEDDFAAIPDRFASPIERAPQPAQQPYPQQQPQLAFPERERPIYTNGERQGYDRPERERPERGNRQDRNQDRNPERSAERGPERTGAERGERGERPYSEKREGRNSRGGRGREYRQDYRHDYRQEGRPDRNETSRPPEEVESDSPGLPAFITAPVRIQPEAHLGAEQSEGITADLIARSEPEGDSTGFHLRPRRRRRTKAEMALGSGASEAAKDAVED